MSKKDFAANLKAKLVAAGYSEKETEHGALVAEMQATMRLIDNPLAAMAVSNTFSKVLALLSINEETQPDRVCAAADIIFDEAMSAAADIVGKREAADIKLTASPANSPSDIN